MSSYNQEVLGLAAFASVDGDAGGGEKFFLNRGFVSLVRTAAGVYTLTMQNAVDMSIAGLVRCTCRAGAAIAISVSLTSTTVLVVRMLTDAGVASDSDFWIEVLEVGPA